MMPSPQHPRALPRQTAALLIGVACFLTELAGAGAAATLTSVSGEITPDEVSMEHSVRLDGLLANVRTTQVIANPGESPLEAVYEFQLPSSAAIRTLTVVTDGTTSTGRIVQADAAITAVTDPEAVNGKPDLAILRMVSRAPQTAARRATATYELRVYPVQPKKTARIAVDWVMPVGLLDARAVMRIPGRAGGPNLVREQVRISTGTAPYGTRFSAAQLSGSVAKGNGAKRYFLAPSRGDLVIEAAVTPLRQQTPWTRGSAVALSSERGVFAVEIAASTPHLAKPSGWDRVIVVADTSRSLGEGGRAAVRTLVSAILTGIGASVRAELVLFDRKPRRVFGGLVEMTPGSLRAADTAIATSPMANGSDLGRALGTVRAVLAEDASPSPSTTLNTLIVVLTDGYLPLSLTEARLRLLLGDDVLATATLTAVFIAHDKAPMADVEDAPLAALALRSRGRALIVREGEALARRKTITEELARPAPTRLLELSAPDSLLTLDTDLGVVEAGEGLVLLGSYRGVAPKNVELRYRQAGQEHMVFLKVKRDPGGVAAPLWLLSQADQVFATEDSPERPAQVAASARRALTAALAKAPTVAPATSLVALDPRDMYGKQRIALLGRGGPSAFTRLPPPPERTSDDFAPFQEDTVVTGAVQYDGLPSRTGELDGTIIERLFTSAIVPRAKICYQDALRRDPNLGGQFTIVAEMVAGEVHHAELENSTLRGGSVEECVLDSVYALDVPRVAQGATAQFVGIARYPIRLRHLEDGEIEAGIPTADEMKKVLDPSTPLGGLNRSPD